LPKIAPPIRIDELPFGRGVIGITFAPGRKQRFTRSGPVYRSLHRDLDAIRDWGASLVITLMPMHELYHCRIDNLPGQVRRRGMLHWHIPIEDVQTPDRVIDLIWPLYSSTVRKKLRKGEKVLVHCRGGLGRAGMIAARILVDAGVEPLDALRRVREVRGDEAIETVPQERWATKGLVKLSRVKGKRRKKRRSDVPDPLYPLHL
jgi:ADP-ribosyl-[dinitrogen reductase] hydrolase